MFLAQNESVSLWITESEGEAEMEQITRRTWMGVAAGAAASAFGQSSRAAVMGGADLHSLAGLAKAKGLTTRTMREIGAQKAEPKIDLDMGRLLKKKAAIDKWNSFKNVFN